MTGQCAVCVWGAGRQWGGEELLYISLVKTDIQSISYPHLNLLPPRTTPHPSPPQQ